MHADAVVRYRQFAVEEVGIKVAWGFELEDLPLHISMFQWRWSSKDPTSLVFV
ncbi:hypothetical protein BWQ96_01381 [Gracilariopsis chorda]|uniref:Uncharacterized protein n=1 Tax=Gracilariopsis chorda TaxID=448386 RepID=A0A2V3J360_9FLOR|nr:hypothetical protein BWQ96_01381 [Gracilariopsis chorda]|eukprot:PXF48825.1 hypothetical protein BWQ96_01381 [Gracilariopsis chorda]